MLYTLIKSALSVYLAGVIVSTAIGAIYGGYSQFMCKKPIFLTFSHKDGFPIKDGFLSINKGKYELDLYGGAVFGLNYGYRWPLLISDTTIH